MVQATGNFAFERQEAAGSLTQLIDKWIYVFMAAFLIVVTLMGFIPDSFSKIDMIETGKRPPFPLVLHFHALLTGSWLVLLLAQSWLGATGKIAGHRSLGRLAVVIGPLLVLNGILLVPVIYAQHWDAAQASPDAKVQAALAWQAKATLLRIKHGILFAVLVAWALKLRLRDSATHKRLMILAPLSMMAVATTRMTWLPTTMPIDPWSTQLIVMLLATPMFGWDFYRTGKVQKAYLIWLGFYLSTSLAVQVLWNSDWWQGVVPGLMGHA